MDSLSPWLRTLPVQLQHFLDNLGLLDEEDWFHIRPFFLLRRHLLNQQTSEDPTVDQPRPFSQMVATHRPLGNGYLELCTGGKVAAMDRQNPLRSDWIMSP